MALSLQDPVQGKRRFFHAVSVSGQAAINQIAITFFTWLMTQGGKPLLQVVEFASLTTSAILADAACHLYAAVVSKPNATAASFKATDSASAASHTAFAVGVTQAAAETDLLLFPKGLAFANGICVLSDTTMAGSTASTAGDGASGAILIGA